MTMGRVYQQQEHVRAIMMKDAARRGDSNDGLDHDDGALRRLKIRMIQGMVMPMMTIPMTEMMTIVATTNSIKMVLLALTAMTRLTMVFVLGSCGA